MTLKSDIPEGLYPMRVVTRMTGLSVDTIRAWERRYGAVQPERTEGNARRYSAEQVRRLTLLKEATDRGHAIRELAQATEQDLRRLLDVDDPAPAPAEEGSHDGIVDAYLGAIERFDTRRSADLLARSAALLTPTHTVFDIIVPILREVGERWSCGEITIAHEHMVSSQLNGLLSTMLRMTSPQPGARRLVVATPAQHRHEFGALIGAFIAASRGMDPLYLGVDVPWPELRRVVDHSGAEVVLLSIVRELEASEVAPTKKALKKLTEHCEVWVGCPEDHAVARAKTGARLFHRYDDLDMALTHSS